MATSNDDPLNRSVVYLWYVSLPIEVSEWFCATIKPDHDQSHIRGNLHRYFKGPPRHATPYATFAKLMKHVPRHEMSAVLDMLQDTNKTKDACKRIFWHNSINCDASINSANSDTIVALIHQALIVS